MTPFKRPSKHCVSWEGVHNMRGRFPCHMSPDPLRAVSKEETRANISTRIVPASLIHAELVWQVPAQNRRAWNRDAKEKGAAAGWSRNATFYLQHAVTIQVNGFDANHPRTPRIPRPQFVRSWAPRKGSRREVFDHKSGITSPESRQEHLSP
jgi:hypothetical protein